MMARIYAWLGETKALPETTEACPVKTEAKKEPAPEETETMAEPEEVPERATEQETTEAAEDRTGEQRLTVGCRGRLKTRTKRDGRLRQECAATVGWPTRHFIPALCKGGLRKGLGKERGSGIRGQGKASGDRMRGRTRKRRLERKEAGREIIRQSLGREIARLIVGSYIGL
jgi:hypothetical protein